MEDGVHYYAALSVTPSGAVTQYVLTFDSGEGIAAGQDGRIWLTDPNAYGEALGRLATDDSGYTTFPTPNGGDGPQKITAGPTAHFGSPSKAPTPSAALPPPAPSPPSPS